MAGVTSRARPLPEPVMEPERSRPIIVLPGTPVEVALDRLRWVFEEMDDQITVSCSGGKDSTVLVELALIVARERGVLPLRVMWLDQECEYASTVEYMRWMADRPEINLQWYQIPFRLFNATNHDNPWLNVWGEGEEWTREKEPDSIHVNDLTDDRGRPVTRFKEVLAAINRRCGGGILTGMRADESPARRMTMTTSPAYKWVTWGSNGRGKGRGEYWFFQPIYDWTYRDVWKAIETHGWRYNKHYDHLYAHGVPHGRMRVSNYHHETALTNLLWLQEVEPRTWDAATRRLQGISTYGHLAKDQFPTSLPFMFSSWEEYLDHLIENLVPEEEHRKKFRAQFRKLVGMEKDEPRDELARFMARVVVANDIYGTKVNDRLVNVMKRRRRQA